MADKELLLRDIRRVRETINREPQAQREIGPAAANWTPASLIAADVS
jgi:hypothetical protein